LFIVDTDGFQFIDSTGMGDIASAFTRVKMRTGRIVWISPTTIQPAYQLARFEKGIEIVPDLAAALQALTGHAVKVPSQLQYEDRYTVSMKEEGHVRIPGNGDRWFRAIMIAIPG
jgi:hypothetical protein